MEICGNDITKNSLIQLYTVICLNSTLKVYYFKKLHQRPLKCTTISWFYNGDNLWFQGSPIGRSSSPIDMIGSPHSPTGNGSSTSCPQYPDAMALAGQNYQHFMDLTKDVQKLSVVSKLKAFFYQSNFFILPWSSPASIISSPLI